MEEGVRGREGVLEDAGYEAWSMVGEGMGGKGRVKVLENMKGEAWSWGGEGRKG